MEFIINNLGSREQRGYFRPGAGSTDPPNRGSLIFFQIYSVSDDHIGRGVRDMEINAIIPTSTTPKSGGPQLVQRSFEVNETIKTPGMIGFSGFFFSSAPTFRSLKSGK